MTASRQLLTTSVLVYYFFDSVPIDRVITRFQFKRTLTVDLSVSPVIIDFAFCRYFLAVPSGRGAPHHRHLYTVKFTPVASLSATNADTSGRTAYHHQVRKPVRHAARSRPICLSCDARTVDSVHKRERRDFGGKQNRMDEARDDRLRQQQRERWEHVREKKLDDEDEEATVEGNVC